MKPGAKIAVIGDLLYDCFVWADHLPRVGETVTGFRNGFFASGKGGNQVTCATKLGADAFMIGKVGDDERGKFLLHSLSQSGVDISLVAVDPHHPTGTDVVMIDREGHNAIVVVPLANREIGQAELERARARVESADVLLSQLQINLDAVEKALQMAHDAGVTAVLNPAPATEVPDALFALCDYVTPNETEAEFFTGVYREGLPLEDWCERAWAGFRARGVKKLIITLGENGAYYADESKSFTVPPYRVKAVDSTAAGDAFNAALCLQLARGASVREAIAYANAAGAITASRMGSLPSLPTAGEVEEFILNYREA